MTIESDRLPPASRSRLQKAKAILQRVLSRDRHSLRTTIAILKAQQEATLDGILVIGNDARVLSYNRRFLEIWGVPDSAATDRMTDGQLLMYARERVADWNAFSGDVKFLYEHPHEVRRGDMIPLKDGRILSRETVPVTTSDGRVTGRAWYFRDVTEERRAASLQAALFRIAQLSREPHDLDTFYPEIHRIVCTLMHATNFFIAAYDPSRGILTFPYFADQFDKPPQGSTPGRRLTAYVLRTGEPLLVRPADLQAMVARGDVQLEGTLCIDWLGVPLKSGDSTWGVIAVQTYDESRRLTERDKEVLIFVAQHVAATIEQQRQLAALRDSEQRYRQMFENNRAVQLLLDPQSGIIVDANPAAADFYGYPLDDLKRMHIWDINVLGADRIRAEMAAAAEKGRSFFVFRHMLANGEVRDVEIHSGPVEVSGRRLLYSIIHDITERRQAERAVRQSEEKYRNIVSHAPVGIVQTSREGQLITANDALAEILGYGSVEELLKVNAYDLWADVEDRERTWKTYEPRGSTANLEVRWKKKDGSIVWVNINAHVTQRESGTSYVEGFIEDVTERKAAEERLQQHAAAISASMDGIAILNEKLDFTYVNDALARLYGYPKPQAMIGRSVRELYDDADLERFDTVIIPAVRQRGRWRGEATGRKRDGFTFPQEISLTATDAGGMVCVVRDITERTYAEEQIKHLAYHDALTGLPNRLLFKDRLTVALSHAQRDRSRLAVLFLDLDRFKVINDSLGHNIGDQLLQAVATRVQSCVRDSDTVARLGGDEFTLLLPALMRSEDAAFVAQKLIESVRYPFHIEGREFFITTSIGISLYPEDGADAATLIKNADTAMYQAKEQGRDNYQLFNAFVNAKALQRIALEHGLRRALANQELTLYYQPIFDLRSGRITGMEALLRWTHPEMGSVPPAVFIPLAEATGVMVPIGGWALRTACRQAKSWHDAGFRNLSLAVNLSVTQLQQPDLLERVREILDETGLRPDLLELEITESTAMQSPEASVRTLQALKELGIRVSLDDFGTGHSSLAYLKRFPIDTLKIDQSFVRDINTDADTAAIVTAIIAMAHSLRMKVIAEGVEQTEQAAFLKRYACDQMQGFLIKPPVPANEFLELMVVSEA